MEQYLYDKEVDCPVCKNKFNTKKVRTRSLRVLKREEDFFVRYKDINPIFYHIFTCPECGYSSSESEFHNLSNLEREILQKSIRTKWNKRDFGGVRGFQEAEEVYKLALLIGQLLKKPKGYLGYLCLKLSWIYREQNSDKEKEFSRYALTNLEEAYEKERFPIASLDEVSLSYLLGELHRRLGEPERSIKWFSIALDNPDIKRNRLLKIRAREMWSLARDQHKQNKGTVQNA